MCPCAMHHVSCTTCHAPRDKPLCPPPLPPWALRPHLHSRQRQATFHGFDYMVTNVEDGRAAVALGGGGGAEEHGVKWGRKAWGVGGARTRGIYGVASGSGLRRGLGFRFKEGQSGVDRVLEGGREGDKPMQVPTRCQP